MISEERLREDRDLIRKFLISHHRDKDDNSFYMRFCELMERMEDLKRECYMWRNVERLIKEKENEKNEGKGV